MPSRLSTRAATAGVLAIAAAAVGLGAAGPSSEAGIAAATMAATLAVGLVPGAALTLVWRPRADLSLLEWLGFGIVLSFGIVQLMTIAAVSLHVSPVLSLWILLGGASVLAAARLVRPAGTVRVHGDETIALLVILAVAWTLYLVGAPVDSAEDQIHAAIARRLSQLPNPGFENVYVTPGIVYTYPFPGTHYFMALISRLGDIDTLFLYHKIRGFWGLAALSMIYLTSRAVFGSRAVATAVAATAAVFVWNGVFALGFPTGWGQLVPFSHASDIAMSVLLPCLLASAFWYLQASDGRERRFFLVATFLLLLMLTMVHMREVVQFAAYTGCFVVVTAFNSRLRRYLRRALGLLVLTLGIAAAYTFWQGWMVPLVDDIVGAQRAELLALASAHTVGDLIARPMVELFPDSLQKFDQMFISLLPLFFFGGPLVVVAFRRQPLVWLISATMVAYLLVMSVPILAIPYIYLTYFEILHLPVRNVIFFVYLLAGALVYLAAVAVARVDRTRVGVLGAGLLAGALGVLVTLCINRSHAGFFVPLVAAYAMTFFWAGSRPPRTRTWAAAAAVAAIGAAVALYPDRTPTPRSEQVTIRWQSELASSERAAFEREFSLGEPEEKLDSPDEINVWNYRLTDLSVDNVRRIVEHPAVADTHFIDRATFEVQSQPPRGDYLPWGVTYVGWLQYPGVAAMIGAALSVWLLAFVGPTLVARAAQGGAALEAAMREPFTRHAVAFALFVIPIAVWSVYPSVSTLRLAVGEPERQWSTPQAMMAGLPCVRAPRMQARFTEHLFEDDPVMLPERTTCPPSYEVVEWMRDHVPVDAVVAIDRWDPYPPVMFAPQQAVVFPTLEASFIREDTLFDEYYALFYERMRKYRTQPFFNDRETPDERDMFIRRLGVTHILVNPPNHDVLRPALDRLPERFTLRFARDRWAIYEVTSS